jgi:anti-anti-sigma factor
MSRTVKVIRPNGVLDGTKTAQFRGEINDVLNPMPDLLLVDLKEVTFMDSSGLGALVIALKKVRTKGSQLCVCSANEQIRMLFELTSLDQVFHIFENQEAFNRAVLSGHL